jgi:short-subunit dehydrogenase
MSVHRKWAVITGASSGIGKALAAEFAGGGFNVYLTGRDTAALSLVANDCKERFAIEAHTFAADLSRVDAIDQLVADVSSRVDNVAVLVNNAGFGIHGEFASTSVEEELALMNVQLAATVKLTKALLPAMIANKHGRILNIGSVYCFAPVPLQSVYSACKAFLLSFSTSLQNEVAGSGITITVFCPGITQTAFRARAGISEKHKDSGITAEEAAKTAYVAAMAGKHVVVPGLANGAFVTASRLLPRSAFARLVRFINRQRGQ